MVIWTGEYDKKRNKKMKLEKDVTELYTYDGEQQNV